jgi:hypothetical protein
MLQLPEIVPVHEYENSDAPTSPDIFVGGAFGLGSRRSTGSAQYRQWNILQVIRIDSGGLKVDPVSADANSALPPRQQRVCSNRLQNPSRMPIDAPDRQDTMAKAANLRAFPIEQTQLLNAQ